MNRAQRRKEAKELRKKYLTMSKKEKKEKGEEIKSRVFLLGTKKISKIENDKSRKGIKTYSDTARLKFEKELKEVQKHPGGRKALKGPHRKSILKGIKRKAGVK